MLDLKTLNMVVIPSL